MFPLTDHFWVIQLWILDMQTTECFLSRSAIYSGIARQKAYDGNGVYHEVPEVEASFSVTGGTGGRNALTWYLPKWMSDIV